MMTAEKIIAEIKKAIVDLDVRIKAKDREFEEANSEFDKGWAGGISAGYMIAKMDLEEIIKKYRGDKRCE